MRTRWAMLGIIAMVAMVPDVPAGTRISVRLLDAINGTSSARGDMVRALVIAPVMIDGRAAIVANDTLFGTVRGAGVERGRGARHFVAVDFIALHPRAGPALPMRAIVVDVPNARETVDSTGRILGPERPGTLRSRADWATGLLATASPVAAALFFTAFRGEAIERHRRIVYAIGTEMTVGLVQPLQLPGWPVAPSIPQATADERAAFGSAPLRAVTARDNLPADVMTLGIIASDSAVRAAFVSAGWTSPDRSSLKADIATLADAARAAGYDAQPVSTLMLNGTPPAFVFEKVVNSMARRHHLRIWRWGATDDGRARWLVAASRDDGILFSEQRRAFGHRVDPAIDVEREKVLNDLLTAGTVARLSMLPRTAPASPALVNGATPVQTDWRLAVMVLTNAVPR